ARSSGRYTLCLHRSAYRYRKNRDSDVGTHCTNSNDGRLSRECPGGITGILWTEHGEHVPQGGGACGQNPARHEARRHSGRAGNQIRFVSQRSDRASTRPRRAADTARPRRRGDRVRRRTFLQSLAGMLVAPAVARAQGAKPASKIGYLHPATIDPSSPLISILQPRSRQLGYVEGETILLRTAHGDVARLPSLVAELIGLGADVLIVVGPQAVRAARTATSSTPIVGLDLETDPVRSGLVGSWAKPGGN